MDSGALYELAKKIGDKEATDAEKVDFLEAMRKETNELAAIARQTKD